MENAINKLVSAIKEEYNTKYSEWLNMSHEELIEKADEISAARFVKDNIQDSFTEEEAEYLLQFKSPLEILVDRITVLNDPSRKGTVQRYSVGDV